MEIYIILVNAVLRMPILMVRMAIYQKIISKRIPASYIFIRLLITSTRITYNAITKYGASFWPRK